MGVRVTRSENELLSWELASRLVARHPGTLRLIRAFPGGGQYDVLWVLGEDDRPDIPMNRAGGTIQVHATASGKDSNWEPTDWTTYRRSERHRFLLELERAAGLEAPMDEPAPTAESLTYSVIAALVQQWGSGAPISVDLGFVDTSSPLGGGGPDRRLKDFDFRPELLERRPGDRFDEPGYRFWIVTRSEEAVVAFEQSSGTARVAGSANDVDLMALADVAMDLGADGPAAAAQAIAKIIIRTLDGSSSSTQDRHEPAVAGRTVAEASSASRATAEAWVLTVGSVRREVLAFEVVEPSGDGGRWSLVIDSTQGRARLQLADRPTSERGAGGAAVVRGTAENGRAFSLAPPSPSDTEVITGLGGISLPTEMLSVIIHAKQHHGQQSLALRSPVAPIQLELVLHDEADEVIGLVCDFSSPTSQGWSRKDGRWHPEMLELRDTRPGAPEFEDLEDLVFWSTPPELAGLVEDLFDTDLLITGADVAFIRSDRDGMIGFADLPELIMRVIDGIAGCRSQMERWCRADEVSVVTEQFERLESLLRRRTYRSGVPAPWESGLGELFDCLSACLSVLPDVRLVRELAFDAERVAGRTGREYESGLMYLIEHDHAIG